MFSALKSFVIIATSALIVALLASFFLFFPSFLKSLHAKNEKYLIRKIASTKQELIPISLLAETIELSVDQPTNLYSFNCEQAIKKLLATHAISEAHITKIKPDILFVDFELRQPIAIVGNLTNTFVDSEGILFPIFPFYTPKRLPEVYLALPTLQEYYGRALSEKKMQVVRALLQELKGRRVHKIDLIHMDEPTLGRREIVVVVSVKGLKRTLRLDSKDYKEQLENYAAMEKTYFAKENFECIIDLRIPNHAYVRRL